MCACVCVCALIFWWWESYFRMESPCLIVTLLIFLLVTRKLRAEFSIQTSPPWLCCNYLSVILNLFQLTDVYGNLTEAKGTPPAPAPPPGSSHIFSQNIYLEWILITPFGNFQLLYFMFYLCFFLVPQMLMFTRTSRHRRDWTVLDSFVWFFICLF